MGKDKKINSFGPHLPAVQVIDSLLDSLGALGTAVVNPAEAFFGAVIVVDHAGQKCTVPHRINALVYVDHLSALVVEVGNNRHTCDTEDREHLCFGTRLLNFNTERRCYMTCVCELNERVAVGRSTSRQKLDRSLTAPALHNTVVSMFALSKQN